MFTKWDILFVTRFPDTILCKTCHRNFSITKHACEYCSTENHVSSFVAKPRPAILWIDQTRWRDSMAFAIPLSASRFFDDSHNHIVLKEHCSFTHHDNKYQVPRRAMIHQSTRIDGNTLRTNNKIGLLDDHVVRTLIENKLLEWLFGS